MKILITGVFGFIGQSLYQSLKHKYDVKGIGRDKKISKIKKKNNLLDNNITNQNLIKLNFQPDVILHCAGSGSVSKSYEDKKIDYDKNVRTSKEVLKFIEYLKKKPRVIIFSSAAVYGNNCNKNRKKLIPISPYGKNKLTSEKIFKIKSKKEKFDLMILRFYSIYGKGLKKQLIWDVCEKINNSMNVFFGSGNEIRSWINIIDVNRLIQFLIKKGSIKNQILDISGNDVVKNEFLVKKLFKLSHLNKVPFFNKNNKKGDPINQIFNNTKLKNLGWKPKINLSKGLNEYVQWYKKNLKKTK
mgnify:CR=1 FL=1